MKAIRINVDGTFTELQSLNLETLQKNVGGYVEALTSESGKTTFWCNEEGKLERLPVNEHATGLLYLLAPRFRGYDILVGPVVITGGCDSHGNTLAIGKEALVAMGLK